MNTRKISWFMSLVLVSAMFAWSPGDALAQKQATRADVAKKFNKVSPDEQKAAAKRAAAQRLKPGIAGKCVTAPAAKP